jgi:hypothetical protein
MTAQEFFARVWEMLIGRLDGPFNFRLLMQPTVAAILAIRAGLRDARDNRSPFLFWAIFIDRRARHDLRRQGWKDVGNVFIAAVILDLMYEMIVYRWVYPGQVLIVAAVLAFVPYLMIRGPVTRIARRFIVVDRK